VSWRAPAVGERAQRTHTFTDADVQAFAALSGDHNPLHFDDTFVATTRFGRRIIHGGLTTAMFNALVAEQLPGPGSVFLHQEWDYPAPVFVGDTVTAEAEVIESRNDKPIVKLRCVARRSDGTVVLQGESVVYTARPESGSAPKS